MPTTTCTCHKCQAACATKPGWFLPGEAEKAADFLNLPLPEFFASKLGVDWWERWGGDIFLLAPAVKGHPPGREYPGNPRGECIFYKDGRCEIYPARPHECREYMHDDTPEAVASRHQGVAKAWEPHQGQIASLLGRKPESEVWMGGEGE